MTYKSKFTTSPKDCFDVIFNKKEHGDDYHQKLIEVLLEERVIEQDIMSQIPSYMRSYEYKADWLMRHLMFALEETEDHVLIRNEVEMRAYSNLGGYPLIYKVEGLYNSTETWCCSSCIEDEFTEILQGDLNVTAYADDCSEEDEPRCPSCGELM